MPGQQIVFRVTGRRVHAWSTAAAARNLGLIAWIRQVCDEAAATSPLPAERFEG